VTTILRGRADSLGVYLRSFSPRVPYCGAFYGQTREGRPLPEGISVARLIEIIEGLDPGVTELGCHPGESDGLESSYAAERVREVEALCDPRVREALAAEGVELRSFADLPH
jgi:chitin disaccharide deacetylase